MFPILTKFVGGHDREVMLLCNQKFVKEWEKGFWCSQITCLLQTESSIKIENALRLSLTVIKDLQTLRSTMPRLKTEIAFSRVECT